MSNIGSSSLTRQRPKRITLPITRLTSPTSRSRLKHSSTTIGGDQSPPLSASDIRKQFAEQSRIQARQNEEKRKAKEEEENKKIEEVQREREEKIKRTEEAKVNFLRGCITSQPQPKPTQEERDRDFIRTAALRLFTLQEQQQERKKAELPSTTTSSSVPVSSSTSPLLSPTFVSAPPSFPPSSYISPRLPEERQDSKKMSAEEMNNIVSNAEEWLKKLADENSDCE